MDIGQIVGLVKIQLVTQVFGCKVLDCLEPFQTRHNFKTSQVSRKKAFAHYHMENYKVFCLRIQFWITPNGESYWFNLLKQVLTEASLPGSPSLKLSDVARFV